MSRKCENNNYELLLEKRKAIFHINSLRRYYEHETKTDKDEQINLMVLESETAGDEVRQINNAEMYDEQVTDDKADIDTDGQQFAISKQLTDEQRTIFNKMLSQFLHVFCDKSGKTNIITHKIRVTDETPCYQPSYRLPETLRQPVEEEPMSMLQNGLIKRDDEPSWNSALIVIRKPCNHRLRLVNNLVALNERTISEPYMMTNLTELLSRAAGNLLITLVDLRKSFKQVKLDPDSQKYTVFQTHIGTLVYTVWLKICAMRLGQVKSYSKSYFSWVIWSTSVTTESKGSFHSGFRFFGG